MNQKKLAHEYWIGIHKIKNSMKNKMNFFLLQCVGEEEGEEEEANQVKELLLIRLI